MGAITSTLLVLCSLPSKSNRLDAMVREANEVLRSAAQIAQREQDAPNSTAWATFRDRLDKVLNDQHAYMYPPELPLDDGTEQQRGGNVMVYPGGPPEVYQSGQVPIVSYVPGWSWTCSMCSNIGYGFQSEREAVEIVSWHYWDKHQIALCADIDGEKQYGHPGHIFVHCKGTESISECKRCGTQIGK